MRGLEERGESVQSTRNRGTRENADGTKLPGRDEVARTDDQDLLIVGRHLNFVPGVLVPHHVITDVHSDRFASSVFQQLPAPDAENRAASRFRLAGVREDNAAESHRVRFVNLHKHLVIEGLHPGEVKSVVSIRDGAQDIIGSDEHAVLAVVRKAHPAVVRRHSKHHAVSRRQRHCHRFSGLHESRSRANREDLPGSPLHALHVRREQDPLPRDALALLQLHQDVHAHRLHSRHLSSIKHMLSFGHPHAWSRTAPLRSRSISRTPLCSTLHRSQPQCRRAAHEEQTRHSPRSHPLRPL
mmetsp:Transcript_4367/g.11947  ORF Transcript_4367/g.11947 Transcript_4367/m.11947 type:complete len:298 (-) Transcript_4367:73-966(-)